MYQFFETQQIKTISITYLYIYIIYEPIFLSVELKISINKQNSKYISNINNQFNLYKKMNLK